MKKNIIALLILLIPTGMFAISNSEVQYSESFKFGTPEKEFKIIRESNNAVDLIYIEGEKDNYYIYEDIQILTNSNLDDIELNKININIEDLEATIRTLNLSELKQTSPVLSYNYSSNTIEQNIVIVNKNNLDEAYKFKLKVIPFILIDPEGTNSNTELVATLTEKPEVRRYLKKQILGSNIYNPESSDIPFPIAEIDNGYQFDYTLNVDRGPYSVDKSERFTNFQYFDIIYNNRTNSENVFADSLIQKLLRVYMEKDKPLFHHYMNINNNFDYSQYDKISESEGKQLVSKALMYLTWGVEYTPPNINDSTALNSFNSAGNVYPSQILNENNSLAAWLTNQGDNTENRVNNYLPYAPKTIMSPINSNDINYTSEMISKLQAVGGDYFTSGGSKHLANITLTTPFTFMDGAESKNIVGVSLPYVKGGMDSPRTFNYKMTRQYEIIKNSAHGWYKENGIPNDYYYSLDNKTERIKNRSYYYYNGDGNDDLNDPFYPGDDFSDKYNSSNGDDFKLYKGLNLTGVDSLGLLSGSIAMTSFYNRIISLANDTKMKELDNYYKMKQANLLGLNANGLPHFSNNPTADLNSIRLNRFDIERSTVIIPDLNSIQPGDLLVREDNGETEIAIIVDKGNHENSTTFDLSEVLVLTVTKDDGRVALNYWANGGNTLQGFTDEPKNFVVRRLIKITGNEVNGSFVFNDFNEEDEINTESWDPMLYTPGNMKALIDIESDLNNSHWIPNTGELFVINNISFQEENGDGEYEEADLNNIAVAIDPPVDMNYSTSETGHDTSLNGNNILVNKGDGFEFYAIYNHDVDGVKFCDYIPLVTFRINPNSTNKYDRYTAEYNSDIFNDLGFANGVYSLKYITGSGLQFEKLRGFKTNKFGIRPLENNIRPGDDILLNFSLFAENNEQIITCANDNFLAVYDKKMLWRANLFIDDGEGVDWNYKYPWNAPTTGTVTGSFVDLDNIKRFIETNGDNSLSFSTTNKVWYGNNEWNREMLTREDASKFKINDSLPRGDVSMKWEELTGLDESHGKQVIKFPRSIYYNKGNSSDALVKDRVVYELFKTSSPFEFYYQINEQFKAMEKIIGDLKQVMDDAQLQYDSSSTEANKTKLDTATSNYNNSIYKNLNKDTLLPPHAGILNLNLEDFNGSNLTDDNGQLIGNASAKIKEFWLRYDKDSYKPSSKDALGWTGSPGKPFEKPSGNITVDGVTYTKLEAGVDCGGLVYMSEAYIGTPYIRRDINGDRPSAIDGIRYEGSTWSIHDCGKDTQSPGYDYNNNLYKLFDESEYNPLIKPDNMKKLIPGDIFYYHGYHVGIVTDVVVENGNREIDLNNIVLIESTHGGSGQLPYIYGAGNVRTMENYKDETWYIGRLKTK